MPSACVMRYGAAKGVLKSDPSLRGQRYQLLFTCSQCKYHMPDATARPNKTASWSLPAPALNAAGSCLATPSWRERGVKSGLRHMAGGKGAPKLDCFLVLAAHAEVP